MPEFVIEKDMIGLGHSGSMNSSKRHNNPVPRSTMPRPECEWIQSYLSDDKVFASIARPARKFSASISSGSG